MTDVTKKALFTFGRILVLAAAPVLLDAVMNGKGVRDTIGVLIIAALAGVEKWFAENPDYPNFEGLIFPH